MGFFFPSADCLGNHSIQFPRVSLLASLLSPNQTEMNEKIYKKKNVSFLMENTVSPDTWPPKVLISCLSDSVFSSLK